MTTVNFDDIFADIVRASGKPADTTLTAAQQERYARYIQHRLKRIWTWQYWPELTRYEERDTVELSDAAVYVPRELGLNERIGDLYENGTATGVSKNNPYASSDPDWVNVAENEVGIFLPAGETAAAVWLLWRRPAPRFTKVAHSAVTAYTAGDLVYYANTCWEATTGSTNKTPSSSSDYWREQKVPMLFESYVRLGATADVMREDGNLTDFSIMESLAQSELRNISWRCQEPMRVRVMIGAVTTTTSGGAASSSAGVSSLETSVEIDWTDAGATAIYTVPTGYDLIILGWLLTTDAIVAAGTAPELSLGDGDTVDAYWSGTVKSNESDAVHVIDKPQNMVAAGTVVTATITSASTATTHTGRIVLRGSLVKA